MIITARASSPDEREGPLNLFHAHTNLMMGDHAIVRSLAVFRSG